MNKRLYFRISSSVVDIILTFWWGYSARLSAIFHKIRHPTHNVKWREDAVIDCCPGDINCNTCSLCFWCRSYDYFFYRKHLKDLKAK